MYLGKSGDDAGVFTSSNFMCIFILYINNIFLFPSSVYTT